MRSLNCKHAECISECTKAAKTLGVEAWARRCMHHETCSQGSPSFKDTPPMPIKLNMKASTMSKTGSWVVSCPDTGATSSLLKESVARARGLRWKSSGVSLTSATGQAMRVSGEAFLYAKVKGGHTRRIRVVISPDLEDDALISWSDQIKLGSCIQSGRPSFLKMHAQTRRRRHSNAEVSGRRRRTQNTLRNGQMS